MNGSNGGAEADRRICPVIKQFHGKGHREILCDLLLCPKIDHRQCRELQGVFPAVSAVIRKQPDGAVVPHKGFIDRLTAHRQPDAVSIRRYTRVKTGVIPFDQ